ncbi:MAG: glycine/sarcosine/betaine reductase selenoprotein B family protein [Gemmatimonadaceae bacterium]
MADFSELPLRYRLEMALYRWRAVDPVVWTRLGAPLAETKVGLVTTAGLYRPRVDKPFRRVRGGDYSFRIIPDDVDLHALAVGQTSDAFDRAPVEADRNVALPIERLRTLVQRGEVGSAAPRHLSFNGSITAPGRLVRESAPEAARTLVGDGVQAVLLVPV